LLKNAIKTSIAGQVVDKWGDPIGSLVKGVENIIHNRPEVRGRRELWISQRRYITRLPFMGTPFPPPRRNVFVIIVTPRGATMRLPTSWRSIRHRARSFFIPITEAMIRSPRRERGS